MDWVHPSKTEMLKHTGQGDGIRDRALRNGWPMTVPLMNWI